MFPRIPGRVATPRFALYARQRSRSSPRLSRRGPAGRSDGAARAAIPRRSAVGAAIGPIGRRPRRRHARQAWADSGGVSASACPAREQLESYLRRAILPAEESSYIEFHLSVVGCRWCQANLRIWRLAGGRTARSVACSPPALLPVQCRVPGRQKIGGFHQLGGLASRADQFRKLWCVEFCETHRCRGSFQDLVRLADSTHPTGAQQQNRRPQVVLPRALTTGLERLLDSGRT